MIIRNVRAACNILAHFWLFFVVFSQQDVRQITRLKKGNQLSECAHVCQWRHIRIISSLMEQNPTS